MLALESGKRLLKPMLGVAAIVERSDLSIAEAGIQASSFDEVGASIQTQHVSSAVSGGELKRLHETQPQPRTARSVEDEQTRDLTDPARQDTQTDTASRPAVNPRHQQQSIRLDQIVAGKLAERGGHFVVGDWTPVVAAYDIIEIRVQDPLRVNGTARSTTICSTGSTTDPL